MARGALSEYKEFKSWHRFAAQLTRDFIDMQIPGEIEIEFVSPNSTYTQRSGDYTEIKRISVKVYDTNHSVTSSEQIEVEDDEPGDFSPEFRANQLRIVKKPSYTDLIDEETETPDAD
jgi:hypothetical protein